MSEQRHASRPPEPPAKAGPPGSDGAIDIAIEEGEPEIAGPAQDAGRSVPVESPPSSKGKEGPPSSQRVGEATAKVGELRIGETTAKRARAKVTLKIPDDVVSRPQVAPSAPPSRPADPSPPEAPLVPMTPMRIISIEPPPVAAKPSFPAPSPPRPPSVAPPASKSAPTADDSWTPYQPTVADRTPVVPPVSVPRPPRPSGAPGPQPAPSPPRPSYHSDPGHPTPAVAMPVAPPTAPMPPAPPTQSDSIDEIPIVTDEPPPSSGEIEIDDDARPTKPAVLKVPEPKLVPAQAAAFAPSPPAASTPPRVQVAAVHTAVTPVASAVATAAPVAAPALASAGAPPVAVANALSPAVVSTAVSPPAPGPIAPSPPRVVSVAPASPQVSIKDLPPMRSLAPTEPEGLEVHFEDEDPPVSSPRTSEPEAEIAAEDLVSVESAPGTAKQVPATNPLQTETPVRAFIPPVAPGAAPPPAGTPAARGSLPPPPSAAAKPAAAQKPTPRVIVPTSSPLAPPPMSESAPTGRRKARPWWEELFNDDFIRTMAKITDAQIAKEVDFVEESLAVAKGAMLLDLGCGTGRHAIELTRRGYKVVGFDLSLPMLAKAAEEAQERSQKLNFVQGDMREMTFEDTFDGIYCWNTSFGFFEEEKNAQVIQRVHKALKKGGQFMLEVGNRDYIIRQAPSLAWFEGDGCICMDEMSIDWITSRMKVKRTMMMDDGRTKEIDYSVRIYSLHELGRVLHEAGFRVAEVSGRTGTPGVYFGNESPRTMILAEKK